MFMPDIHNTSMMMTDGDGWFTTPSGTVTRWQVRCRSPDQSAGHRTQETQPRPLSKLPTGTHWDGFPSGGTIPGVILLDTISCDQPQSRPPTLPRVAANLKLQLHRRVLSQDYQRLHTDREAATQSSSTSVGFLPTPAKCD